MVKQKVCGVEDLLTFQGEGDFKVTLKHQTYGEVADIFNRLIVSECFEMSQIYFGKNTILPNSLLCVLIIPFLLNRLILRAIQ